MKKQLELDENTARRLYPTAQPELKEILEQTFGKAFFSQKIKDLIRNYNDILEISKVTAVADDVKVVGFDDAENNVVKAFIQKMRTTKFTEKVKYLNVVINVGMLTIMFRRASFSTIRITLLRLRVRLPLPAFVY